jgi:hypothetical protein
VSPSAREPAPREVLSSLPHTRPQRRSPRRAPAGQTGSATTGHARPDAKSTPRSKPAATPAAGARPASKPAAGAKPAAKPPFRAESQGPVDPPSGAEILEAAMQGAGELAHIGLTLSGQLLRSAIKRLPRP